MREWLKVPLEGGNIEQNLPFASDPETLGEPTFEGGDGRKFWFKRKPSGSGAKLLSVCICLARGFADFKRPGARPTFPERWLLLAPLRRYPDLDLRSLSDLDIDRRTQRTTRQWQAHEDILHQAFAGNTKSMNICLELD